MFKTLLLYVYHKTNFFDFEIYLGKYYLMFIIDILMFKLTIYMFRFIIITWK